MSELPVISIVTPCFNAESFLENAIESILSQEYPRLEYYIIDGGSTDRSVDIIKKYFRDHMYAVLAKIVNTLPCLPRENATLHPDFKFQFSRSQKLKWRVRNVKQRVEDLLEMKYA